MTGNLATLSHSLVLCLPFTIFWVSLIPTFPFSAAFNFLSSGLGASILTTLLGWSVRPSVKMSKIVKKGIS